MANKTVQGLVDDIRLVGETQYLMVEAVRALVKEFMPSVTEEVKYGGILFTAGVQFGGVFAYREHVSVEFSRGALIPDVHGSLEGSGHGRRHIKLYALEDINTKHLAHYLPLALQAASGGA